jgi:hypothetical protein
VVFRQVAEAFRHVRHHAVGNRLDLRLDLDADHGRLHRFHHGGEVGGRDDRRSTGWASATWVSLRRAPAPVAPTTPTVSALASSAFRMRRLRRLYLDCSFISR